MLEPISFSKYLYADANPSNLIDPTGLSSDAQSLNTALAITAILAATYYVSVVDLGPPPELPRERAQPGLPELKGFGQTVEEFLNDRYYVPGLLGSPSKIDQTIGVLLAEAEDNAVDGLLDGSVAGKDKSSRQYHKPGGVDKANEDFDGVVSELGVPVRDYGNGIRSTQLADGTTISVRSHSSQGDPTVQINRPTGKPIKIRYRP